MDLHVGLGKGNSIECTLVPEVRKTGHGESWNFSRHLGTSAAHRPHVTEPHTNHKQREKQTWWVTGTSQLYWLPNGWRLPFI
jgi:hypothetical protein